MRACGLEIGDDADLPVVVDLFSYARALAYPGICAVGTDDQSRLKLALLLQDDAGAVFSQMTSSQHVLV